MAPWKNCTEPVQCLYPRHVWPREKSWFITFIWWWWWQRRRQQQQQQHQEQR